MTSPYPDPRSVSDLRRRTTGHTTRLLLVGTDNSWRSQWLSRLPSTQWQVREASSGAAAFEMLRDEVSELILVAPQLPDLDAAEFEDMVRSEYPALQIVRLPSTRSPSAKACHSFRVTPGFVPWRRDNTSKALFEQKRIVVS